MHVVRARSHSLLRTSSWLATLLAFSVTAYGDGFPLSERIAPADLGLGDIFGSTAAVDGGIAIVGSPQQDAAANDAGAAYLIDLATGDVLHLLLADDAVARDFLGRAVDIHGGVAIAGANEDDDNGPSSGSAYLFDVATGAQVHKLVANDGMAGDRFGTAVAIHGTTALVGAWGNDAEGIDAGAVYVFDTTTGLQTAKLVADDATVGDFFGVSVAFDGTTALVGATGVDGVTAGVGAVYAFDVATATQIDKWVASDGATDDQFGFAVAMAGELGIVGAPEADDQGSESGAAYLFEIATGAELHKLLPSMLTADGLFGRAVALEGGVALVGAPGRSRAYLFDAVAGKEISRLVVAQQVSETGLGRSVAIEGEVALVGAYLEDAVAGAAYVMRGGPSVGYRNAGTNPDSYRAGAAWVGEDLRFEIDLTTTGHSSALVIGFDSPVSFPLGAGQTLLCLDLMGNGELFNSGFHSGPLASIDLPVPDTTTLIGLELYTQAIHAFGVAPFALSNAQDIVVGGCPFGSGSWTRKFEPSPGWWQGEFGAGLAIEGGIAVVGSPGARFQGGAATGAAYVLDVATGTQLFELGDPTAISAQDFGAAVAMDADHILVGAPSDNEIIVFGGAGFLFDRQTGAQLFKFTASGTQASHLVGNAIDLDGSLAVFGVSRDDEQGADAGAVYYMDTATGAELDKIFASDAAPSDKFGTSVALEGTTLLVGATGAGSGAVYVIDTTTGTETFKLVPSDPGNVNQFGVSVALSGNTAIIGARSVASGLRAVGYLFDVTTGAELAKIDHGRSQEVSVAIDGGVAVMGASIRGDATLYDSITGAELETVAPGCDEGALGSFGRSVAVDGGTVLVAAPGDDSAEIDAGSVFVFD